MKVAVVRKQGQECELDERETPAPGPGEVRIAVEACGVCHSDAFVKFGFPGLEYPRVPGHEVAGRIDAVGEGAERWKKGDRVGVGWHGGHCFHCDMCRRGDFIHCLNGKITGISHDGGYATAMIAPAESVARIPDGMDAAAAGPLLCAGVTTFNALRNSPNLRPGAVVAVQGIGGLGHLGIQFARRMGCRTVAISRGEEKKELAAELGAHDFIDARAEDPAKALQAMGGADIILATAPHAEAIESVFRGLSRRGQLLIVAATGESLELPGFDFLSGKSVAGWPSGTAADSEDTMDFAARQQVAAEIETFPLEQANEALAKMMENKVRFRAVLTMG